MPKRKRCEHEEQLVGREDAWFYVMERIIHLKTMIALSRACKRMREIFSARILSNWMSITASIGSPNNSMEIIGRIPLYAIAAYCDRIRSNSGPITRSKTVESYPSPVISSAALDALVDMEYYEDWSITDRRTLHALVIDPMTMLLDMCRLCMTHESKIGEYDRERIEDVRDILIKVLRRSARDVSGIVSAVNEVRSIYGDWMENYAWFNLAALRIILSRREAWQVILAPEDMD